MTQYTPAQLREFAETLEASASGYPVEDAATALRSLADQLEQANLQHIAEFGELQDAAPVVPAPGASAWMPIETAPKNGSTMLLGYFNSAGKWRTMRGQWMSQEEIEENWEDPEDGVPGWHETVVESDDIPNCWLTEPTHWMPLPPAPGTQAAPGAPTSEQIARAKGISGQEQTPFEAGCEVLSYLREQGASYYFQHRMLTCLHDKNTDALEYRAEREQLIAQLRKKCAALETEVPQAAPVAQLSEPPEYPWLTEDEYHALAKKQAERLAAAPTTPKGAG